MRTMDADALLKKIGEDAEFFLVGDDEYSMAVGGALLGVKEQINAMPTIEPQRMKGKWETIEGWGGDDVYRCSVCGEEYVLIDGTPKDNGYHFCPNCGADMRGTE